MKSLLRKWFFSAKYGTGKDGDIYIDEDMFLTRSMEYRTLKCKERTKLHMNGHTIKVLIDEED